MTCISLSALQSKVGFGAKFVLYENHVKRCEIAFKQKIEQQIVGSRYNSVTHICIYIHICIKTDNCWCACDYAANYFEHLRWPSSALVRVFMLV